MALDKTGISLSTVDPDNLNDPSSFGGNGAEEAEDYCSAELLYGDSIATTLDAASRVTSAMVPRSLAQDSPRRIGRGNNRYLLLAGAVVVAFVLLIVLND
jgi:hypothetical protein